MNKCNREFLGKVISTKMTKTITVCVNKKIKHPLYGKFVMRSTKYHVHDEFSVSKDGDMVKFIEVKPYSKTKCWKLHSIVTHIKK